MGEQQANHALPQTVGSNFNTLRTIYFLILLVVTNSCTQKKQTREQELHSAEPDKQEVLTPEPVVNAPDSSIWDRIDARVAKYQKGTSQISPSDLTEDFNMFHDQFVSDSAYQHAHIHVDLIGAVGFCESTKLIDNLNWEYTDSDFRDDYYNERYSNRIYANQENVIVDIILTEVSKVATLAFKKVDGEWYLHVFFVNAC